MGVEDGEERELPVWHRFECPDVAEPFVVRRFEVEEELARPFVARVEVTATHEGFDAGELLGRDAVLSFGRGDAERRVAGIVDQVTLTDDGEALQSSRIRVVPALVGLARGLDTRIFQDQSAVSILESVLGEELGRYGRGVDLSDLDQEAYATRDFCVQYRESPFDFAHRLMEEEGIGYRFDFEAGEDERMVLFDASEALPEVTTLDEGPVVYDHERGAVVFREPIVELEPRVALVPQRTVVCDHDWTRGNPRLEATAEAGGGGGPTRGEPERYEHGHGRGVTITEDQELLASLVALAQQAVIPAGLPMDAAAVVRELAGPILGPFTSDDVATRARRRHELAVRDVRTARGRGLVTSFTPGQIFDLLGHPTLGADGRYLLTRVVHQSHGSDDTESAQAEYVNRFACLPAEMPWRPTRRTPKPRIYGSQTAFVTGPMGMNVYTDVHGRVRVRFVWDRADPEPSGHSSAWVRVSQAWAGAGYPGFSFIPRVGMEVVVTFLDGDPDRPLITGCVHDGRNPTPHMLPVQATKSVIRTRTIPHGPGYNELSFEDAMGAEKIYLRAERDLQELVRRTHRTRVERDRVDEVVGDRLETVGRNARATVGGDMHVHVHGDDARHVSGSHQRVVRGGEHVFLGTGSSTTVERGGHLVEALEGDVVASAKRHLVLTQNDQNLIALSSDDAAKGITVKTPDGVRVSAGEIALTLNETEGTAELSVGQSKITMRDGHIEIAVGSSKVVVTPAAVQVNSETKPASG